MHTALVSRLLKDRSAWELAHVPVESESAEESPDESGHHANLSGATIGAAALAAI
jgi:hypothetical protein